MIDRKKMIKEALGRIKKLSLSATAGRYKAKSKPKDEAPAESKADPEIDDVDEAESEKTEDDAGESAPKNAVLITMLRKSKADSGKVPVKKKPKA